MGMGNNKNYYYPNNNKDHKMTIKSRDNHNFNKSSNS